MEAYEEMKVGSRVVMDTQFTGSLGDVHVTIRRGEEATIIKGFVDNDDLDPQHRLWLLEVPRYDGAMFSHNYHLWFRANKLGLIG